MTSVPTMMPERLLSAALTPLARLTSLALNLQGNRPIASADDTASESEDSYEDVFGRGCGTLVRHGCAARALRASGLTGEGQTPCIRSISLRLTGR